MKKSHYIPAAVFTVIVIVLVLMANTRVCMPPDYGEMVSTARSAVSVYDNIMAVVEDGGPPEEWRKTNAGRYPEWLSRSNAMPTYGVATNLTGAGGWFFDVQAEVLRLNVTNELYVNTKRFMLDRNERIALSPDFLVVDGSGLRLQCYSSDPVAHQKMMASIAKHCSELLSCLIQGRLESETKDGR